MSPEQVVALLAILADQRLAIDRLSVENTQLRQALAVEPPPPAD